MNNDDKRLIVCDLDGTLLNSDGLLTKKTINIVKEVIKKGHIFCISTGRPFRSAIKYYNELGLTTIMSNLNGALITNPSDKYFIEVNNVFSKEILFRILKNEIVMKKMIHVYVENFQGGIIFRRNDKIKLSQDVVDLFHIDVDDILKVNLNEEDWHKYISKDLYSILINIKEEDLDEISFAIKSCTTTLFVDYWKNPKTPGIITLEIRSVFQNKGKSFQFISCYYGIPFRNAYSFGDEKNDIEMMKLTTRSYAMKNGHYAVKMASYKITEFDNNTDGVARELKMSLLKK
ncbi:MAG: HAD family hydrolase [Mycoplasmoidaceae bacterium]